MAKSKETKEKKPLKEKIKQFFNGNTVITGFKSEQPVKGSEIEFTEEPVVTTEEKQELVSDPSDKGSDTIKQVDQVITEQPIVDEVVILEQEQPAQVVAAPVAPVVAAVESVQQLSAAELRMPNRPKHLL